MALEYTTLLATELQPVLTEFYPLKMSGLNLLNADDKVIYSLNCTIQLYN